MSNGSQNQIADPGPLGLAAFAITTLVLCTYNAGLLPAAGKGVVFMLAFWYGGIVQILVGMWEIKKNNVFGAVAFTSYGAFWLAFGSMEVLVKAGVYSFSAVDVGIFLLGFSIFTFYMWLGTFKLNNALLFTFTVLELAFIFLTLGEFGLGTTALGGWFGLAAAAGAFYTSAAGILNTVYNKKVLPIGPRNMEKKQSWERKAAA
ncbi:MAG: acetate uptake transporter [Thermoanaerobacteraceae bacterium]|nr:acetate uptake transporter [Thermoanaerobacteraceae bacterium]